MPLAHRAAALLLVAALAGCLGAPDAPGPAPGPTPGNGTDANASRDSGRTGAASPDDPSDGNATNATDGGTTRRTHTNSTTVPFNAGVGTGTALLGAGDMTLLASRPANFTGILLEFT